MPQSQLNGGFIVLLTIGSELFNENKTKYAGKDREHQEHSFSAGGNVQWYNNHFQRQLVSFLQSSIYIYHITQQFYSRVYPN
jgi:hypothetical protein